MITNRELVKAMVGEVVTRGYIPYFSAESADDHGVNWEVLSREEFEEALCAALKDWQSPERRHAA